MLRRRSVCAIRKAWLEVVAQQSAAFSPALENARAGDLFLSDSLAATELGKSVREGL